MIGGDPKFLQLLEEIRNNSRQTKEILEHISSQLSWMIIVLIPILLANFIAAAMLFILS